MHRLPIPKARSVRPSTNKKEDLIAQLVSEPCSDSSLSMLFNLSKNEENRSGLIKSDGLLGHLMKSITGNYLDTIIDIFFQLSFSKLLPDRVFMASSPNLLNILSKINSTKSNQMEIA